MRSSQPARHSGRQNSPERGGAWTQTIAILDDRAGFRGAVAETLRGKSLQTLEFEDGDSLIDRIQTDRPDVIVINDGVMASSELAGLVHRLRSLEPKVPIILLTNHRTEPAREGGSADQAASAVDRCIQKPYGPLELIDTVNKLLSAAGR
jgi:CheY-like chemotaxis protein